MGIKYITSFLQKSVNYLYIYSLTQHSNETNSGKKSHLLYSKCYFLSKESIVIYNMCCHCMQKNWFGVSATMGQMGLQALLRYCFCLLCIQQQCNATYFSFRREAVRLTVSDTYYSATTAQPIVQAKEHISRIITCCILLPVCPTMLLCEMHRTSSKYIPILMFSQG